MHTWIFPLNLKKGAIMPLHSQWIFFLIATWKQVKFWQCLRWKFGIIPLFIFKSTFLSAASKGFHTLCKQDSSRASALQLNQQNGICTKGCPPHRVCGAQLAQLTQAVYALLCCLDSRCIIPLGFSTGRGTVGPWIGLQLSALATSCAAQAQPPQRILFLTKPLLFTQVHLSSYSFSSH